MNETSGVRWRHRALVCAAMALLALAPLLLAREPPQPEKLITIRTGTVPIIITAPHGGRTPIPGAEERKGNGVTKFVTVRDTNTDLLAEKLAAALEKQFGGKPYLVIAHFERKYADVNRPAKDAYEGEAAKPYYEAYHKAVSNAYKEVQKDWARGLLIDIHAQGADEQAIFRGTNDGKTVTHLRDRFGKEALTGPKSVLGVLAKKGYKIIPANDSDEKEDRRYSGGYTVQTYGSKEGGTIDALQLETGGKFRQVKNLDQTATDLAAAITVFAKEYLPAEKKAK